MVRGGFLSFFFFLSHFSSKKNSLKMEMESRPSLDQSDPLSDILTSLDLALLFRNFLRQRDSSRYLSFWYEIEDFKATKDGEKMLRKGQGIILKYLAPASDNEINLENGEREKILRDVRGIMNGDFQEDEHRVLLQLFDNAQHTATLILTDLLPPFQESDEYKQNANNPNTKSRKGQKQSAHSFLRFLGFRGNKKRDIAAWDEHEKGAKKEQSTTACFCSCMGKCGGESCAGCPTCQCPCTTPCGALFRSSAKAPGKSISESPLRSGGGGKGGGGGGASNSKHLLLAAGGKTTSVLFMQQFTERHGAVGAGGAGGAGGRGRAGTSSFSSSSSSSSSSSAYSLRDEGDGRKGDKRKSGIGSIMSRFSKDEGEGGGGGGQGGQGGKGMVEISEDKKQEGGGGGEGGEGIRASAAEDSFVFDPVAGCFVRRGGGDKSPRGGDGNKSPRGGSGGKSPRGVAGGAGGGKSPRGGAGGDETRRKNRRKLEQMGGGSSLRGAGGGGGGGKRKNLSTFFSEREEQLWKEERDAQGEGYDPVYHLLHSAAAGDLRMCRLVVSFFFSSLIHE